ncbi:hypothetical protein CCHR01_10699 [Colletotrichum chrysophilum]|uniref:Uncharacterized protein n=1 Tax=Colletotrichum chrysophilum TaxID=1836956 RepID=A0AAD9EJ45_9PEZI|nr:hypothetical protein CCHR01_10699 [Colletotrichum chrysophilum]
MQACLMVGARLTVTTAGLQALGVSSGTASENPIFWPRASLDDDGELHVGRGTPPDGCAAGAKLASMSSGGILLRFLTAEAILMTDASGVADIPSPLLGLHTWTGRVERKDLVVSMRERPGRRQSEGSATEQNVTVNTPYSPSIG